jgi:PAS domain S-box-containing protein
MKTQKLQIDWRALLLGILAMLPLGITLAFLRRYIGLFLTATEYRQALLDHAVDGIILIDDDGIIHAFNPAAEKIFGYIAGDMLGQNLREIVAPPDHVLHKLISIGREATGIKSDGTNFPLDMTSGQMKLSGQRMYILIVRDATRRKQIEDELRRARDDAEAASRAKSAFLLTMSHELRTPLGHIIGYGELVREELAAHHLPELVADIEKIESAGRHLLHQIDDVLDLANLESGQVKLMPERFALQALLDEICAEIQPLLQKHENQLTVEAALAPGTMEADRGRVRQVLANLLSNAAKFTQNGRILLRVSDLDDGRWMMDGRTTEPQNRRTAEPRDSKNQEPHSTDEQRTSTISTTNHQPPATSYQLPATNHRPSSTVIFEITDTGIGIAPEQVPHLFEPFRVANVTTRQQGGSGLGLAIADRLCRLMGGDIHVETQLGHGSTFTVRLPVEQKPGRKPSLLSIEDRSRS